MKTPQEAGKAFDEAKAVVARAFEILKQQESKTEGGKAAHLAYLQALREQDGAEFDYLISREKT